VIYEPFESNKKQKKKTDISPEKDGGKKSGHKNITDEMEE
jgi:hypothetical protein